MMVKHEVAPHGVIWSDSNTRGATWCYMVTRGARMYYDHNDNKNTMQVYPVTALTGVQSWALLEPIL